MQMSGADLRFIYRITPRPACALICIDAAHCLRCRHGSTRGELGFTRTSNEQLDKDDFRVMRALFRGDEPPTVYSNISGALIHAWTMIWPTGGLWPLPCDAFRAVTGVAGGAGNSCRLPSSGVSAFELTVCSDLILSDRDIHCRCSRCNYYSADQCPTFSRP